MKELQVLERVAATTTDPQVREKAEKLIAALKDRKDRTDGRQAKGGVGDRVFVKVQRAADKSA